MEVHQFLGEGVTKKQLYMGNCQKRGAWQKIGGRWGWYVDADYDLILVHAGT